MIRYTLVKGYDTEFVDLVNGMINDGWELFGNTFIHDGALCQALTSKTKPEYKPWIGVAIIGGKKDKDYEKE